MYLSDIGRHALLTKEEEVRLAQVVEAGREAHSELLALGGVSSARVRELRRIERAGEAAAETFTNGNLRLVVSIAKQYRAAELPLLDLVQEGNLGLMHAVEKFDWRKGFKFSTYATWWIRQAIARGITNTGRTIRLPVHAGDLLNRVVNARDHFEARHGRRATIAELARDLEVSADRVTEVLRHVVAPISLSEPLRHDSRAELGDLVEDHGAVSPFDAAATALLPGDVAKMLTGLDGREREVIRAEVRPQRRQASDPRGGRCPFWAHPGADPPDRSQGHGQATTSDGQRRQPDVGQRLTGSALHAPRPTTRLDSWFPPVTARCMAGPLIVRGH